MEVDTEEIGRLLDSYENRLKLSLSLVNSHKSCKDVISNLEWSRKKLEGQLHDTMRFSEQSEKLLKKRIELLENENRMLTSERDELQNDYADANIHISRLVTKVKALEIQKTQLEHEMDGVQLPLHVQKMKKAPQQHPGLPPNFPRK